MGTNNEEKMDKLARMVADGFSHMESKFDDIDSKFDNIDSRFTHIESVMATKQDLANLRDDIDIMLDRN